MIDEITTPGRALDLLATSPALLLESAATLRRVEFGGNISLCAIINIKNGNCGMDCAFCAQSRHLRGIGKSWPLLPDDALKKSIDQLASLPVAHIGLVASGSTLKDQEFGRLLKFIENLPASIRGRLCVSLGTLDATSLKQLRQCGIRRYHHNLETAESFYPRICSSQQWRRRRQTVLDALDAGLDACCGGLFGMGETWMDRIEFAFTLKRMGIKYIPMNFLDPRPGTPLESRPLLAPEECLLIIALFRHILPKATLRICGGRVACLGKTADRIFQAGANALMTGDYLTTHGSGPASDLELLGRLGLTLVETDA